MVWNLQGQSPLREHQPGAWSVGCTGGTRVGCSEGEALLRLGSQVRAEARDGVPRKPLKGALESL